MKSFLIDHIDVPEDKRFPCESNVVLKREANGTFCLIREAVDEYLTKDEPLFQQAN
jgi:hypothetical protein